MTSQAFTLQSKLPDGFLLRHPTHEDAAGVAELVNAVDMQLAGESDSTTQSILDDWHLHHVDLESNAWLVVDPAGKVVGFETLDNGHGAAVMDIDGYVHPEYEHRGIGTCLLSTVEARVREVVSTYSDDKRVVMQAGTYSNDKSGIALFNGEGFAPVRYFWRMIIQMDGQPPTPTWPAGVHVRPMIQGQDEPAIHAAMQESFVDHWNFAPTPYKEWLETRTGISAFDPNLWYLAIDDATNEIAGIALCRFRHENAPWINTLGVRKPWRKQGVGLALLYHAFTEFYNKSYRSVGLGVDAANPTGATRLYERAGMHPEIEYTIFEKVVREGE